MAGSRPAIGDRSDDQQSQTTGTRSGLPQDAELFFVAQLSTLPALPQFTGLPGNIIVLLDLFRRELFPAVDTARTIGSRPTQAHVGPRAAEQFDALAYGAK